MEKIICVKDCKAAYYHKDGASFYECFEGEIFYTNYFSVNYERCIIWAINDTRSGLTGYLGMGEKENFEIFKEWQTKNRNKQIDLILE